MTTAAHEQEACTALCVSLSMEVLALQTELQIANDNVALARRRLARWEAALEHVSVAVACHVRAALDNV